MNLFLQRFAYTPHGTFGRLLVKDWECFTVERPWFSNQPNISCIPCGLYSLSLGTYHRGGYAAWEVLDVPNRSLIKIHIGNTMDDLMGCIAPGMSLGYVNGLWAVLNSKLAHQKLMEVTAFPVAETIDINNVEGGHL